MAQHPGPSLCRSDSKRSPINEVHTLEVILYDTSTAGNLDLANNAAFSAINTGTAIAGLNTNRLLLQTDATVLLM